MAKPDFSPEQLAVLVKAVQKHIDTEYDLKLGRFEAENLIAFMAGTIGALLYNRGLHDAQALLARQVESLGDAIYQMERPVGA
ncbi:DUF2164 domain-containing protein [Rhizobium cremeum]|uniref:DUF2164 domain-containing protein n=1 Tax=Rhizobium cremeum TaxID=2813827 RepID=UPI000DE374D8|nr:DUF2164 domain-containing protein [Rhizobium cremeum]MCJ7993319.1 DUF2164 domain-containing protein [Rhizobium cremeum]MCJ7998384.1 DUF2164 domain-containing protein [Rhizobium cremeum]